MGRMATGSPVGGLRRTEVPTVSIRVTAWARVASGTEASVARAAQATARVNTEGRYAWQEEGARGDEDRREDGRGSGEGAGAAWRGPPAAMVAQRRGDGGAGGAGQGMEEDGTWLGAHSAHGAHFSPTTTCSVCLPVSLFVCACAACHWRTGALP